MIDSDFQNSLIRAIYDASPDAILVVDNKDIIVSHNHKFAEIWRIPSDLLKGKVAGTAIGLHDAPILSYVLSQVKDSAAFLARVKELYADPELIDYCEIELADGRFIERHSTVLFSNSGSQLGRVWFFRDITEQKKTEIQLKLLSLQDPLTGIANRRYFFEKGEQEFVRTKRYLSPLSVALLDIDHFKQINDRYGHDAGDKILASVCHVIRPLLREVDLLARVEGSEIFARIGGEEFAVLLPNTHVNQAIIVADRLRKALENHSISIKNGLLKCTASIGVTMQINMDVCFEDMLIRADKALYAAKNNGRNRLETA